MFQSILPFHGKACLEEERLRSLADGDIPEPGLSLCLKHLADCQRCSDRLDRLMMKVTLADCPAGMVDDLDPVPQPYLDPGPFQPEFPPLGPVRREGDLGSIGKYLVDGVLGHGSAAVTWSSLEPELNRRVAIKMLLPSVASDAEIRNAFQDEARAMAAIHHAGIVPVFTVDEHEGNPYFVMPLLDGESLQARLARGPLGSEATRVFTGQLAEALAAAHAQGLVHRDVKPSNIWIRKLSDGSEAIVLLDFGIAMPTDAGGSTSGTCGYRSPEQAMGEPCDARSDFFALGCVVYEMLTGRQAWPANGDGPDLRLPLADPGVPPEWRPLLRALFALDPLSRPASPREIGRLLPRRSRRGGVIVATVGMALLMVSFGVVWMALWQPPPRPGAPFEFPSSPKNDLAGSARPAAPIPVFAGLKPRLAITGENRGPMAVSGNGTILARADQPGRVEIVSTTDGTSKGSFAVGGRIRRLSPNRAGTLLAVALESNTLNVHRVSDGGLECSFPFGAPDGREAWVGKDNATLMVLENCNMRIAHNPSGVNKSEMSMLVANPWQGKLPLQAVDFAGAPESDQVAVLFAGKSFGIMNLVSGKIVQFDSIVPFLTQQPSLVWRDPATPTLICERKVMEYGIREKGPRDLSLWELPISAQAFVWTGENEYAAVSDTGGRVPAVYLGQRGNRGQRKELSTEGVWIDRLQWVAESRTLLAFGRDGSVRLYDILPAPVAR